MINYAIDVPGGWQIEGQLFAMFRVFRVHFSSSEMLATFCVSGAFRVARVPCSGMFRVVRVACSGYVPGAFLTTAMYYYYYYYYYYYNGYYYYYYY